MLVDFLIDGMDAPLSVRFTGAPTAPFPSGDDEMRRCATDLVLGGAMGGQGGPAA